MLQQAGKPCLLLEQEFTCTHSQVSFKLIPCPVYSADQIIITLTELFLHEQNYSIRMRINAVVFNRL